VVIDSAWDDDDRLLADLGEALAGAGPRSAAMVVAGQTAYAWRDVDQDLELLALVHDSRVHDGGLVRSSASPGPRILVFQGGEWSLELEVAAGIVGQVIPPQPCRIALVDDRGTLAEVDADPVGFFRLARPARGLVRLTCRSTERVAATRWLQL
jgi:hypothetical protein